MTRARWPRPTAAFLATVALLVIGVAPLPADSWARWVRQSVRSLEPNRADRKGTEAGYYEGLINVGQDGAADELTLRMLGKPQDWVNFHDLGATRYARGDILQFELYPNLRRVAFGRPFETNSQGLRDREYAIEKPAGTYRIALLGASIDMGWGVASDETYENRLEDWLNGHAARRGLTRRFEVLNFSMAAYGPVQRVEAFRRKAAGFRPDLVLYSGTMLDDRLTQIHLCDLLTEQVEVGAGGYGFIREALTSGGLDAAALTRGPNGQLVQKERIKAIVQGQFERIVSGTLGLLEAECRGRGIPLYVILIPRAGESDLPDDRAPMVGMYTSLAGRLGLPIVDLTSAFDDEESAAVSLAPWDDHPNTHGHKLLFRALAGRIVADASLYRTLFGTAPLAAEPDHHSP